MEHTCTKRVLFLRHGQAVHNPRAEAAREAGCTHEHFLELTRQDDAFDSPLTTLGEEQAREVLRRYGSGALLNVGLVVASSLSRALRTADWPSHHRCHLSQTGVTREESVSTTSAR